MRNEVVISSDGRTEVSLNRCDFCGNKEHVTTLGNVSVDPKYADLWFCSYNCLHSKKYSKGVVNAKNNNKQKNRKAANKICV